MRGGFHCKEPKLPRWQWLGRVMLDSRLPDYVKAVGFWMCEHANKELLTAFPAVETLVKLTGLSKSQVQRARRTLVECGWLSLIERKPGPHGSARYKLTTGLTVLPTGCADVNAAKRMFVQTGKLVSGQTELVSPQTELVSGQTTNGVYADTNSLIIGVRADTRTSSKSEPPKEPRQSHRQDQRQGDADGDGELARFAREGKKGVGEEGSKAQQIAEAFKQAVLNVWGNNSRPFVPMEVLEAEAQHQLNAGFTPRGLIDRFPELAKKMRANGHAAPMCISAFRMSLADDLEWIRRVRLNGRSAAR